jgi:ATP-dependent helicase/nuclease subunit A
MDGMGKALYLMQHEEYLYERGQKYSEADLLSYRTMLEQITETVCAQTMNSTQNIAAAMEEYVDTTLENQLVLQHQFKAVRMMNLHKAKGLEGNIVIVPDRKKEISFKQGTVQIVESGKRVSVVSIRMGKGIKYGYVLDEALENLAQKEERADRIRLEYVEVTRAREAFIVMDSDVDQCLFSDQYTLSDCPEIFSKLKKAVEQEDNSCQTAAATERVEKRCFPSSDVQILEEQQKKCYIDITPSMFETNGSAEKKKYLLEGQEPQKEERIKGNVFGTMMHRAIELFVQKWRDNRQAGTDVLQKLADQSICRAIMENQDDLYKKEHCENEEDYLKQAGAYHKALAGALRSFYADAHIKTLVLNAEAVHTEMPFSFITTIKAEREKKGEQNLFTAMKVYLEHEKIDIEDGQEVWIHGICDLVAEQQDGSIAIVDYKSDTKDSLENEQFHEYLNKKYEGQMTLYKYALKHIYPDREVKMPRLWSLYEEAAEES